MRHIKFRRFSILFMSVLCALATAAYADSFPDKTIKIIVPFSAGGTTDLITRALAADMSEAMKSDVVVENKNGAAGTIGAADVARSPADGSTIGMLPVGPLTTQPHLRKLPYSIDSFDYVCQVYSSPQVLAVRADSPFQNVADFVSYAKENPRKIKFGSTGPGTIPYLSMRNFSDTADIEIVDVPFKGEAEILTALLGGHVGAMVSHAAFVVDHAESVKALGIMASQRAQDLPDLPTFQEQGVAVESTVWGGLAVRKGTPAPIIETLEKACKSAAESPRLQERMSKLKTPLAYMDSKTFADFVVSESARNGKALGASKLEK